MGSAASVLKVAKEATTEQLSEAFAELSQEERQRIQDALTASAEVKKQPEEGQEKSETKSEQTEAPFAKMALPKEGKELAAERLTQMGFDARQLLTFCKVKQKDRKLNKDTSTNEVVRKIIIPETASRKCRYMESDFMEKLGGRKMPKKLVSHSWATRFEVLVKNILMDITGLSAKEIESKWFGFEPDEFLETLSAEQLAEITYWLCIFAVNQHKAICGDCFVCNAAKTWTAEEYKLDICPGPCKTAKFNPCMCGSSKTRPGDEDHEIDLFEQVMAGVPQQVVSLDPDITTLDRIWVVSELAEALMHGKTVHFRMTESGSDSLASRIRSKGRLFPSVRNCKATSEHDKRHILQRIEGKVGYERFDNFVQVAVDLSFGRLDSLQAVTASELPTLKDLTMNFTYVLDGCTSLASIGITDESFRKLLHLETLRMTFEHCSNLQHLDGLNVGLIQLSSLKSLSLNCWNCKDLTRVSELDQALSQLTQLQKFTLDLGGSGISDTFGLLGHLPSLTELILSFRECKDLCNISALGLSLSSLSKLTKLDMDFEDCSSLTSISSLGFGLSRASQLTDLRLKFFDCEQLSDALELGKGVNHLLCLNEFYLSLHGCGNIPSVLQTEFRSKDKFLAACSKAEYDVTAPFAIEVEAP